MKNKQEDYCLFEYLYRDASNYKNTGTLLLSGKYTKENEDVLRKCMENHEYFIAEQVGIPPLNEGLWEYTDGEPNEEDHCWHEFSGLNPVPATDIESYVLHGSLNDLIKSFQEVEEWNLELSSNFGAGGDMDDEGDDYEERPK